MPNVTNTKPPPRLHSATSQRDNLSHLKCSCCGEIGFVSYETPHNCLLCDNCFQWRLSKYSYELQSCPGGDPSNGSNQNCMLARSFRREDCIVSEEARHQLASVYVHCSNTNCPYVMQYMKLQDHEANDCRFARVSCNFCRRVIYRDDLTSHQNSDECRQFLVQNLGNYS